VFELRPEPLKYQDRPCTWSITSFTVRWFSTNQPLDTARPGILATASYKNDDTLPYLCPLNKENDTLSDPYYSLQIQMYLSLECVQIYLY
jgi:hypothetical protein